MSSGGALVRLNDHLHDILVAAGIACVRGADCIRIGGADIVVGVTAIWDNPAAPRPDERQTFGVEVGIKAPSLLGETAYEFSYGWGENAEAAAASALGRWVELDLAVLLEASSDELSTCLRLDMPGNDVNGAAPGTWRIYLGPLQYTAGQAGAQPCCQTCLLAMSMPHLRDALRDPVSCAIKIVASRHEDGSGSADCRRNGHDLPDAITRIAEAAREWAGEGVLQTRRQYIYFRAPPTP